MPDALKQLSIPVSVIIPFFNRIDCTVKALQSVQCQTYRNLDIILVDDGSSDDLAPLQVMMQEDPRIRYVRTENGGAAAARNVGIDLATGTYIAFLDSDDTFDAQKIEIQLQYMQEQRLDFSHTSYVEHDLDRGIDTVVNSGAFAGNVYPKLIQWCVIATPTVMLRRDFVGARRFPSELRIGEDICFWIDLAADTLVGGIRQPLSTVNLSHQNTSYDSDKHTVGILNTATYVMRSEVHRMHKKEVENLLKALVLKHQCSRLFLQLYLFVIFFRSARNEGFMGTLKKVTTFFRKRQLSNAKRDGESQLPCKKI